MTHYSIIVPAFNEAARLPQTLELIRAAMDHVASEWRGELIVVDNNSTDATSEIATRAGAQVVFEPINQISRARNAGARVAVGEWLIFIDADTQLSPALLNETLTRLQSGIYYGGGAHISFDTPLNFLCRSMLTAWHLLAAQFSWAAGCYVYCTRDAFNAAGGFPENVFAGEELDLSARLRRYGKARGQKFSLIAEPQIITSARRIENSSLPRLLWTFFTLGFFPPLRRFKSCCPIWYRKRG